MSEQATPFGIPKAFIDFVKTGTELPENDMGFKQFPEMKYSESKGEFRPRNWAYFAGADADTYPFGYYPFPYVNLTTDDGEFVWFPDIKDFGQLDLEHGVVKTFGDDWEEVWSDFVSCIEATLDDVDYDMCRTFEDEKIEFVLKK